MAEPHLTSRQMRGLAALCDTVIAPVRPPRARAGDPLARRTARAVLATT